MLRAKSRLIQQYDLALRPYPDIAATADATFDLATLYGLLQPRIDSNQATYKARNETVAYRIVASQLNITGGYITLLIQHGDKNASDTGFVNLNTGAIRHARKGDDEGIGACGHFVILTSETAAGSQSFAAALETIPGISRSIVQRLLNSEFKHACEGQLIYQNDRGKDKPLRPIGELLGRPSETLVRAIRGGQVEDVFLVSREVVGDMDEVRYISEAEKTLRYGIDPGALGDRAMRLVQALFGKAKQDDARAMRIRFRDDGRSQTVELNLEADGIEDT